MPRTCPGYFSFLSNNNDETAVVDDTEAVADAIEPVYQMECSLKSVARFLQQLYSSALSSSSRLLHSMGIANGQQTSEGDHPSVIGPFVRFGNLQRTSGHSASSASGVPQSVDSGWLWTGSVLVVIKNQRESPLLLFKSVSPAEDGGDGQEMIQVISGSLLDSVGDEMFAWRFDLQIPLIAGYQQTIRYMVLPTVDAATGQDFLDPSSKRRWLACFKPISTDADTRAIQIPAFTLAADRNGQRNSTSDSLFQALDDGGDNCFQFFLPAAGENMHWLFGSCNGRPPPGKLDPISCDPVVGQDLQQQLRDIRQKHQIRPFHLMVGCGDQIYLDGVFCAENCPTVAEWLGKVRQFGFETVEGGDDKKSRAFGWRKRDSSNIKTEILKQRTRFIHDGTAVTTQMLSELERFIFNGYCNHFMEPDYRFLLASIPQTMIWDDHDIFDGYGSHPAYIRLSPVIQAIYRVCRRFYLLFQLHTTQDRLLTGQSPSSATELSELITNGRSVNFLKLIGSSTALLGVDIRSERTINQCTSSDSWQLITARLQTTLPAHIRHLIIIQTIPVIWPSVRLAERTAQWLSDWWKRLKLPAKQILRKNQLYNALFFPFGEQFCLLDDMTDQWCSERHIDERRWMVDWLQRFGAKRSVRITFISGDPHAAGVGRFRSISDKAALQSSVTVVNEDSCRSTSSTVRSSPQRVRPSDLRSAVKRSFSGIKLSPSSKSVFRKIDRHLIDCHDSRLMYSMVSSALTNLPPPGALITALHISDGLKTSYRTDISINKHTAEGMLPIFSVDDNGEVKRGWFRRKILDRRNWCEVAAIAAVHANSISGCHSLKFTFNAEENNSKRTEYSISVPPLFNWEERESILHDANNNGNSVRCRMIFDKILIRFRRCK